MLIHQLLILPEKQHKHLTNLRILRDIGWTPPPMSVIQKISHKCLKKSFLTDEQKTKKYNKLFYES